MKQIIIFLPLLAQILLTAIVFFYMYHTRVKEMRDKRIHPQEIAINAEGYKRLTDSSIIAEHFANLFEMPVLFYILCLSLYVTQMVTNVFIVMGFLFVLFRAIHSLIHCTYNKVMHRFYAYAASSITLWSMWLIFSYQVISNV